MTKKKIEKIAEKLGWTVEWSVDGSIKSVMFRQPSPDGQDFFIELEYENIGEIEGKIRDYYDSYDPSQEAYYWLDDNGHGKNGAPYEMVDVYNDMKACEEMLNKLACAIEE